MAAVTFSMGHPKRETAPPLAQASPRLSPRGALAFQWGSLSSQQRGQEKAHPAPILIPLGTLPGTCPVHIWLPPPPAPPSESPFPHCPGSCTVHSVPTPARCTHKSPAKSHRCNMTRRLFYTAFRPGGALGPAPAAVTSAQAPRRWGGEAIPLRVFGAALWAFDHTLHRIYWPARAPATL